MVDKVFAWTTSVLTVESGGQLTNPTRVSNSCGVERVGVVGVQGEFGRF